MREVLRTWFLLWLLIVLVVACAKDDSEREPAESAVTNKTNICGADWEGDNGDLVFPGLVTYEECEDLCEPIYEQLVEDGGSGFCQFGTEKVWEYPYYSE